MPGTQHERDGTYDMGIVSEIVHLHASISQPCSRTSACNESGLNTVTPRSINNFPKFLFTHHGRAVMTGANGHPRDNSDTNLTKTTIPSWVSTDYGSLLQGVDSHTHVRINWRLRCFNGILVNRSSSGFPSLIFGRQQRVCRPGIVSRLCDCGHSTCRCDSENA